MKLEDAWLVVRPAPSGDPVGYSAGAVAGGADMVLLDRCVPQPEMVRRVAELCGAAEALLGVGDDPETAAVLGCGMHLGDVDGPIGLLRGRLGMEARIGCTTRTPDEVRLAATLGYSYVVYAGRDGAGWTEVRGAGYVPLPVYLAADRSTMEQGVAAGWMRYCIDLAGGLDEARVREDVAGYSRLLGRCV